MVEFMKPQKNSPTPDEVIVDLLNGENKYDIIKPKQLRCCQDTRDHHSF